MDPDEPIAVRGGGVLGWGMQASESSIVGGGDG
jgi:hypothetical protein